MGNTHTPDGTDHDYYRRPADGIEPPMASSVPQRSARQEPVQIIDDGSGPDAGAGHGSAGAGTRHGLREGPEQTEPGAALSAPAPLWQRVNLALAVAWVLVGLLLVAGLAWLTGVLPPAQMTFDASGNSLDPPSHVMLMNLHSMGPFLFLFGVMGAFTLLTVQAAGYRRKARS